MGGSIARDPLFWTVSVGLVMVAVRQLFNIL